jgi:DNA-binding NarL/FixJ family response regulator
MTIRIVIADDHRIMRDGLVALLRGQPDFEVVGEAPDGAELARLTRKLKPDIAEAIRRIRADEPEVKLLCLSVHAESRLVLAVLDAGASGYVLKECSFEELVQAIRQVVAGQVYLSAQLVGVVVQEYRARVTGGAPQDSASVLTPRERELVQLFSEGYSTNAIAERLYVSAKTVATHRQHILQKLRIGSMAELTRYALREGLSSLESGGASALRAA